MKKYIIVSVIALTFPLVVSAKATAVTTDYYNIMGSGMPSIPTQSATLSQVPVANPTTNTPIPAQPQINYLTVNNSFVSSSSPIVGTTSNNTVPTSFISHISLNSPLGYKSSGNNVEQLQQFLISQNCLTTQPTGYFGSLTLAGVKCFQTKNNISPTGYVGQLTLVAINAANSESTTSTTSSTQITVASSSQIQSPTCMQSYTYVANSGCTLISQIPVTSTSSAFNGVLYNSPEQAELVAKNMAAVNNASSSATPNYAAGQGYSGMVPSSNPCNSAPLYNSSPNCVSNNSSSSTSINNNSVQGIDPSTCPTASYGTWMGYKDTNGNTVQILTSCPSIESLDITNANLCKTLGGTMDIVLGIPNHSLYQCDGEMH